MTASDASLERALGYRFREASGLARALTHRSACAEHNERLEFLGDALLNFVVGETVFQAYPRLPEGDLSRLRAALVRESTLASVARSLALGEHVQLGSGELKSGGFRRDSILADTLEAVIGAVYLDGGFEPAQALCRRLIETPLAELPDPAQLKDAKTRLQEFLQARGRGLPEYEVLSEEGPAHRRQFSVLCRLADAPATSSGFASNRKLAEQRAAQMMLDTLQPPDAAPDA